MLFLSQGFAQQYPFSSHDLSTSLDVLRESFKSSASSDGSVDWLRLRYLIGEVLYGGHVADESDRLVVSAHLLHLFQPALLTADRFELAPASAEHRFAGVALPAPGDRALNTAAALADVASSLKGDSPLALRSHAAAAMAQSEHHALRVLELIPRLGCWQLSTAGDGDVHRPVRGPSMLDNAATSVREIAEALLGRLPDDVPTPPASFDAGGVDSPRHMSPGGSPGGLSPVRTGIRAGETGQDGGPLRAFTPYLAVLAQEVASFNTTLRLVRQDLTTLAVHRQPGSPDVRGALGAVCTQLMQSLTPASWATAGEGATHVPPSRRQLSSWWLWFHARACVLHEWLECVARCVPLPPCLWLPALVLPGALLTAIKQVRRARSRCALGSSQRAHCCGAAGRRRVPRVGVGPGPCFCTHCHGGRYTVRCVSVCPCAAKCCVGHAVWDDDAERTQLVRATTSRRV